MSIDLTEAFDNMNSPAIVTIIVNWFNTQELIDFAEDEFSLHDGYNESHVDACEDEEEDGDGEESKQEKLTPWDQISQQEQRAYIMENLQYFSPDSLATSFLAVLSSDDIEKLAENYFPGYLPDEEEDIEEEDIDDEDVEEELMDEEW